MKNYYTNCVGDNVMNQQDLVMKKEQNQQSKVSASDNPGVRFPAPMIFLSSIFIGVGIDQLIHVPLLFNNIAHGLGITLVILSFIILGFTLREFRKAKTPFRSDRSAPPVTALIISGPFRWSRNPGYVSITILQAGIGVWTNNIWIIALLVPVVILTTYYVIAQEEQYLTIKFGSAYQKYREVVGRWL